MKKIVFFFGFLLVTAFTKEASMASTAKIVIMEDSKLLIAVRTNVNRFECHYNVENINNPVLVQFNKNEPKISFDTATLELYNDCFDCGNKGINRDFKKLLHSDEHPTIALELLQIIKRNALEEVCEAQVQIAMAGAKKTYWLPITLNEEGTMSICGSLDLKLSDFHLEAPKKALGMVVVKDGIVVKFDLKLKRLKS